MAGETEAAYKPELEVLVMFGATFFSSLSSRGIEGKGKVRVLPTGFTRDVRGVPRPAVPEAAVTSRGEKEWLSRVLP